MNEYLDICLLSQKCCHTSFLMKYRILAHHFAVTNCYICLLQQPKFLKHPFSTLQVYKASNTEQETSLNCNYNFTCSISAHTQILYSNTKNTFEYQNNERISEQCEYSL